MTINRTPGSWVGSADAAGSAASSRIVGPISPISGVPVWLTISGTWAGSVRVQRSTDGGLTKADLTALGSTVAVFTANCCEVVHEESEDSAELYLDITISSGSLTYRVGQ